MSWKDLEFFTSNKHKEVIRRLEPDIDNVIPDRKRWFYALALTPLDKTKAIILGQDPYPNRTHAMGLAFSVPKEISPIPPSLVNIYKELENDLGIIRKNGDLTPWARQGVLLINSSLTTLNGQRDAHKNIGWEELIQQILHMAAIDLRPKVFIAMGINAQKLIPNSVGAGETAHLLIRTVHPSPLSARNGFFGSQIFSRTNKFLKSTGQEEISWQ
jgi:uracil-DNA glycosylase